MPSPRRTVALLSDNGIALDVALDSEQAIAKRRPVTPDECSQPQRTRGVDLPVVRYVRLDTWTFERR